MNLNTLKHNIRHRNKSDGFLLNNYESSGVLLIDNSSISLTAIFEIKKFADLLQKKYYINPELSLIHI